MEGKRCNAGRDPLARSTMDVYSETSHTFSKLLASASTLKDVMIIHSFLANNNEFVPLVDLKEIINRQRILEIIRHENNVVNEDTFECIKCILDCSHVFLQSIPHVWNDQKCYKQCAQHILAIFAAIVEMDWGTKQVSEFYALIRYFLKIVADMSDLHMKLKDAFVKYLTVPLMRVSTKTELDDRLQITILKTLASLLERADKGIRTSIATTYKNDVHDLASTLATSGDYEWQCYVLETIFRLHRDRTFLVEVASYVSKDISVQATLASLQTQDFDVHMRYFLNELNLSLRHEQKVFSLECYRIFIGHTEIYKPRDSSYVEFWADFNLSSGRISVLSEALAESQGSSSIPWQQINIFPETVVSIMLRDKGEKLYCELYIKLDQDARLTDALPDELGLPIDPSPSDFGDARQFGTDVLVLLRKDAQLLPTLQKLVLPRVYGTRYKGFIYPRGKASKDRSDTTTASVGIHKEDSGRSFRTPNQSSQQKNGVGLREEERGRPFRTSIQSSQQKNGVGLREEERGRSFHIPNQSSQQKNGVGLREEERGSSFRTPNQSSQQRNGVGLGEEERGSSFRTPNQSSQQKNGVGLREEERERSFRTPNQSSQQKNSVGLREEECGRSFRTPNQSSQQKNGVGLREEERGRSFRTPNQSSQQRNGVGLREEERGRSFHTPNQSSQQRSCQEENDNSIAAFEPASSQTRRRKASTNVASLSIERPRPKIAARQKSPSGGAFYSPLEFVSGDGTHRKTNEVTTVTTAKLSTWNPFAKKTAAEEIDVTSIFGTPKPVENKPEKPVKNRPEKPVENRPEKPVEPEPSLEDCAAWSTRPDDNESISASEWSAIPNNDSPPPPASEVSGCDGWSVQPHCNPDSQQASEISLSDASIVASNTGAAKVVVQKKASKGQNKPSRLFKVDEEPTKRVATVTVSTRPPVPVFTEENVPRSETFSVRSAVTVRPDADSVSISSAKTVHRSPQARAEEDPPSSGSFSVTSAVTVHRSPTKSQNSPAVSIMSAVTVHRSPVTSAVTVHRTPTKSQNSPAVSIMSAVTVHRSPVTSAVTVHRTPTKSQNSPAVSIMSAVTVHRSPVAATVRDRPNGESVARTDVTLDNGGAALVSSVRTVNQTLEFGKVEVENNGPSTRNNRRLLSPILKPKSTRKKAKNTMNAKPGNARIDRPNKHDIKMSTSELVCAEPPQQVTNKVGEQTDSLQDNSENWSCDLSDIIPSSLQYEPVSKRVFKTPEKYANPSTKDVDNACGNVVGDIKENAKSVNESTKLKRPAQPAKKKETNEKSALVNEPEKLATETGVVPLSASDRVSKKTHRDVDGASFAAKVARVHNGEAPTDLGAMHNAQSLPESCSEKSSYVYYSLKKNMPYEKKNIAAGRPEPLENRVEIGSPETIGQSVVVDGRPKSATTAVSERAESLRSSVCDPSTDSTVDIGKNTKTMKKGRGKEVANVPKDEKKLPAARAAKTKSNAPSGITKKEAPKKAEGTDRVVLVRDNAIENVEVPNCSDTVDGSQAPNSTLDVDVPTNPASDGARRQPLSELCDNGASASKNVVAKPASHAGVDPEELKKRMIGFLKGIDCKNANNSAMAARESTNAKNKSASSKKTKRAVTPKKSATPEAKNDGRRSGTKRRLFTRDDEVTQLEVPLEDSDPNGRKTPPMKRKRKIFKKGEIASVQPQKEMEFLDTDRAWAKELTQPLFPISTKKGKDPFDLDSSDEFERLLKTSTFIHQCQTAKRVDDNFHIDSDSSDLVDANVKKRVVKNRNKALLETDSDTSSSEDFLKQKKVRKNSSVPNVAKSDPLKSTTAKTASTAKKTKSRATMRKNTKLVPIAEGLSSDESLPDLIVETVPSRKPYSVTRKGKNVGVKTVNSAKRSQRKRPNTEDVVDIYDFHEDPPSTLGLGAPNEKDITGQDGRSKSATTKRPAPELKTIDSFSCNESLPNDFVVAENRNTKSTLDSAERQTSVEATGSSTLKTQVKTSTSNLAMAKAAKYTESKSSKTQVEEIAKDGFEKELTEIVQTAPAENLDNPNRKTARMPKSKPSKLQVEEFAKDGFEKELKEIVETAPAENLDNPNRKTATMPKSKPSKPQEEEFAKDGFEKELKEIVETAPAENLANPNRKTTRMPKSKPSKPQVKEIAKDGFEKELKEIAETAPAENLANPNRKTTRMPKSRPSKPQVEKMAKDGFEKELIEMVQTRPAEKLDVPPQQNATRRLRSKSPKPQKNDVDDHDFEEVFPELLVEVHAPTPRNESSKSVASAKGKRKRAVENDTFVSRTSRGEIELMRCSGSDDDNEPDVALSQPHRSERRKTLTRAEDEVPPITEQIPPHRSTLAESLASDQSIGSENSDSSRLASVFGKGRNVTEGHGAQKRTSMIQDVDSHVGKVHRSNIFKKKSPSKEMEHGSSSNSDVYNDYNEFQVSCQPVGNSQNSPELQSVHKKNMDVVSESPTAIYCGGASHSKQIAAEKLQKSVVNYSAKVQKLVRTRADETENLSNPSTTATVFKTSSRGPKKTRTIVDSGCSSDDAEAISCAKRPNVSYTGDNNNNESNESTTKPATSKTSSVGKKSKETISSRADYDPGEPETRFGFRAGERAAFDEGTAQSGDFVTTGDRYEDPDESMRALDRLLDEISNNRTEEIRPDRTFVKTSKTSAAVSGPRHSTPLLGHADELFAGYSPIGLLEDDEDKENNFGFDTTNASRYRTTSDVNGTTFADSSLLDVSYVPAPALTAWKTSSTTRFADVAGPSRGHVDGTKHTPKKMPPLFTVDEMSEDECNDEPEMFMYGTAPALGSMEAFCKNKLAQKRQANLNFAKKTGKVICNTFNGPTTLLENEKSKLNDSVKRAMTSQLPVIKKMADEAVVLYKRIRKFNEQSALATVQMNKLVDNIGLCMESVQHIGADYVDKSEALIRQQEVAARSEVQQAQTFLHETVAKQSKKENCQAVKQMLANVTVALR